VQPFQITVSQESERLPLAKTCFNQLVLPSYSDRDDLYDKLMLAITECHSGFGFA